MAKNKNKGPMHPPVERTTYPVLLYPTSSRQDAGWVILKK